jgi:hypothetical protein
MTDTSGTADIALSALGYLNKLRPLFKEILVAKASISNQTPNKSNNDTLALVWKSQRPKKLQFFYRSKFVPPFFSLKNKGNSEHLKLMPRLPYCLGSQKGSNVKRSVLWFCLVRHCMVSLGITILPSLVILHRKLFVGFHNILAHLQSTRPL